MKPDNSPIEITHPFVVKVGAEFSGRFSNQLLACKTAVERCGHVEGPFGIVDRAQCKIEACK